MSQETTGFRRFLRTCFISFSAERQALTMSLRRSLLGIVTGSIIELTDQCFGFLTAGFWLVRLWHSSLSSLVSSESSLTHIAPLPSQAPKFIT